MTYDEWIENLTDKQKEKFDKTRCNIQDQISCKKQYARYTEVWVKENVPKTFDEFPNIKYNKISKYKELKLIYADTGLKKICNTYNLKILEGKHGKHVLG